jgi:hypothetical protein
MECIVAYAARVIGTTGLHNDQQQLQQHLALHAA